jgi:hypothetical protein
MWNEVRYYPLNVPGGIEENHRNQDNLVSRLRLESGTS